MTDAGNSPTTGDSSGISSRVGVLMVSRTARTDGTGLTIVRSGKVQPCHDVARERAQRRAAPLSTAYNGASVGGVMLSPLWVALIAAIGLTGTAAAVGAVMALAT